MQYEMFVHFSDKWRDAAIELAAAITNHAFIKHQLKMAEGNAWAEGQVTGVNADARKASLYIILEPFKEKLIRAEEAVMTLTHQERYLRDMVEYAMWNGTTGSPSQWEGLRGHVDAYIERRD
jgi:hypothetical protein